MRALMRQTEYANQLFKKYDIQTSKEVIDIMNGRTVETIKTSDAADGKIDTHEFRNALKIFDSEVSPEDKDLYKKWSMSYKLENSIADSKSFLQELKDAFYVFVHVVIPLSNKK